MFILPPNCIVPSATSLTMRPVFPSFLYFISHTPCGRSGRHQIDTFGSTWPGQNWALTEWPVNVESGPSAWEPNVTSDFDLARAPGPCPTLCDGGKSGSGGKEQQSVPIRWTQTRTRAGVCRHGGH